MTARARRALALVTAGAALLAPVAPSLASGGGSRQAPPPWVKINRGDVDIVVEPGLLRTRDGVLHVAYPRADVSMLEHTAEGLDRTVASHASVLSGWNGYGAEPDVVPAGGGSLRVTVHGLQDTDSGNQHNDGRARDVVGNASGTSWALQDETLTNATFSYSSTGNDTVALSDLTPVTAITQNGIVAWQVGVGPNAPSTTEDPHVDVDGSAYHVTLGRTSADAVYAAWSTLGNGAHPEATGVHVMRITPSTGADRKAPHGAATDQGVALVVNGLDKPFVAYCALNSSDLCDHVELWDVFANRAYRVPGSANPSEIALAAAPAGRLWVVWRSGYTQVSAVRTNPDGSAFEPVQRSTAVPGASTMFHTVAEASRGFADVVVNTGNGLFAHRFKPALRLGASPTRWHTGERQAVVFHVTDAGADVADAHVRGGGESCTTRSDGTCRVVYPARSRPTDFTATASRSGFVDGRERLHVVR